MPSGVRNLMPASVTFLSIIESEVGILHHNQNSILHCIVTSIILFIHINSNTEMSKTLSMCLSECSKYAVRYIKYWKTFFSINTPVFAYSIAILMVAYASSH